MKNLNHLQRKNSSFTKENSLELIRFINDIVVVIDGTMLGNFLDETKKVQKLETVVLASTDFPRYRPEDEIVMTNVASHTSIDFVVKNLLS